MTDERSISEEEYKRRSRRSVLTGAAAVAAGYFGFRWVQNDEPDGRIPGVLRSTHELNGAIWQTLYDGDKRARTFDPSRARDLRINGRHGVRDEIDLSQWEMEVVGRSGSTAATYQIGDITSMPFVEMTVEHKCVEGWSEIVTWGGTPFSNLAALHPGDSDAKYVSLETPDGKYYVGLERAAMMHPQTLLCWELNNEPLTQLHGAPLRLVTPLKYGIKQLKRIGRIEFTDDQPADYWARRGYDYYSGL